MSMMSSSNHLRSQRTLQKTTASVPTFNNQLETQEKIEEAAATRESEDDGGDVEEEVSDHEQSRITNIHSMDPAQWSNVKKEVDHE